MSQDHDEEVQSKVDQIISNVTKSSSGIFHLLQVPSEIDESTTATTTATEDESIRMESILLHPTSTTDSDPCHRVKKLQSIRERNAIRLAFQKRMIASGEFCGPLSCSSSSADESNDAGLFEEYRKRINDIISTNGRMSIKLYSQPSHPYSRSSDEMSDDTLEPFKGFAIDSEYSKMMLVFNDVNNNSAKKLKLSVGPYQERPLPLEYNPDILVIDNILEDHRDKDHSPGGRAGSLSDNYLTSASLNDSLDQGAHSSASPVPVPEIIDLNSVVRMQCEEEITKFDEHIKHGDPGAKVQEKENSLVSTPTLRKEDDTSLNLTYICSDEVKKTIVKEEILNAIKSKTGLEQQDLQDYHCSACSDRFLLETGLYEHLHRKTVKIDFKCEYCNTSLEFNNQCNLLQHLKDHEIRPTDDYLMQYTVTRPMEAIEFSIFDYGLSSSKVDEDNGVSQPPSSPTSSLIKVENEKEDMGSKTPSECVDAEAISELKVTARTDDGVYVCLKCVDYITSIEDEFYAHVKSTHTWSKEEIQQLFHKNGERSEFWCPECNAAFVTKLSLIRHLKADHEFLQDVPSYLQKVGYDGKIPLLENQCEVCYRMFQLPSDLVRHIRSHGLAFLRLQKRQKLQYAK